MARSGFDRRFGYVRWLFHLIEGEAPNYAKIGRAVGKAAGGNKISGQAVSGWAKRETAPDSWKNNKALAAQLGVDETWLIDGEGAPPRPELWAVWIAARNRKGPKTIESLPAVTATGKKGRGEEEA